MMSSASFMVNTSSYHDNNFDFIHERKGVDSISHCSLNKYSGSNPLNGLLDLTVACLY